MHGCSPMQRQQHWQQLVVMTAGCYIVAIKQLIIIIAIVSQTSRLNRLLCSTIIGQRAHWQRHCMRLITRKDNVQLNGAQKFNTNSLARISISPTADVALLYTESWSLLLSSVLFNLRQKILLIIVNIIIIIIKNTRTNLLDIYTLGTFKNEDRHHERR